jgi:replicative DNA helicase
MSDLKPLYYLEAEITILGAVLRNNSRFHEAAEIARREHFYLDSHRRIFQRMGDLLAAGTPVDLVILADELRRHHELEAIGGFSYLCYLTEGVSATTAVRDHAATVKELAQMRQLMALGDRLVASAADPGSDLDELLSSTESRLLEMRAETSHGEDTRASSAIVSLLDQMNEERSRTGELLGLPTGVSAFDLVTRGLQPGQNIAIGSTSGGGKSAFGIQAATECARLGNPVLIFSVEMTKDEILRRIFSAVSRVPFIRVRDPKWATDQDIQAIRYAAEKVADWPLFIDADSSIHIDQLVARARLAIRKDGVRLIVADYCQIIRADGKDERLRVASVSRGLTRLAKDEGVPVMVLSQLARPDKSSPNRRPRMNDLRESSQLENDAHVIALLHRPVDDEGHPGAEADLIIAKQRAGAIGTFPLTFNRATLTFEDRKSSAARQAVAS